MVKGTHKQMVVVRTNDSRYYEQAYFVLRDGSVCPGEAESTMMAEANRILDESMLMPQPRPRRRPLTRRIAFLLGALLGVALSLLCMLVLMPHL